MPRNFGILVASACTILLLFACLAAGCTSGTGPAPAPGTTPPSADSATTIMIKDFSFNPSTISIPQGTTVTWVNGDGMAHTVESDAGAPVAFASPELGNGGSYRQTFTQAGTYAYHCSIHPSMKGTIVVTP